MTKNTASEAGLLNKISCSAPALGVTEFIRRINQLLPFSADVGPRYVLKLLFCEKLQYCL
jgi:hypothetical protein